MAPDIDLPREFTTMRGEDGASHPIAVRPGLDVVRARSLLQEVEAISWGELYHAYGAATDVPGQLAAVIAGDDETREEAWWNLWGNVHHQGTIYEATVPAVPILLGVAGWLEHPDRAQATLMLREIAAAPGVYVWRSGEDDDLVTIEDEQQRLYPELRSALTAGAAGLLDAWREEPEDVQRALLWLLSALPDLRAQHEDLVEELLPERYRAAWEPALAGTSGTEEDADAVFALEEWVHSGGC